MDVRFASTFPESLKYLISSERWYNKALRFFRYDIIRFVKNVWRFRKPLTNHYWWDHHAILQFMEIGLDHMAHNLETNGMEIDEPRLKKVAKIKRTAELIRNYNQDLYIEMAEKELGEVILHDWEFEDIEDKPGYSRLVDNETEEEKEHNRKVYERAREIGNQEWKELWSILQGQDNNEYQKLQEILTEEQKREEDHYYKWFDGSDMRGWWD